MSSRIRLKRLALCSVATALCGAGQGVWAHTGVKSSAEEGVDSYNAFVITHGCSGAESGPSPKKVIGQSAVFPFRGSSVWTDLTTPPTVIQTGGANIISGGEISLQVAGLQDSSVFAVQTEETKPGDPPDPYGAAPVRALNWMGGPGLETNLYGLTNFKFRAPTITDPCVTKLQVRVAVVNWCKEHKNEANDDKNNRADWWFTGPDKTGSALFVDPDLVQSSYWTTITVNNTDFNAASCAGTPHEVAVQPSGDAMDELLPLEPFTKGPGPY